MCKIHPEYEPVEEYEPIASIKVNSVNTYYPHELDEETIVTFETIDPTHDDAYRFANETDLFVAAAPGHHLEKFIQPIFISFRVFLSARVGMDRKASVSVFTTSSEIEASAFLPLQI